MERTSAGRHGRADPLHVYVRGCRDRANQDDYQSSACPTFRSAKAAAEEPPSMPLQAAGWCYRHSALPGPIHGAAWHGWHDIHSFIESRSCRLDFVFCTHMPYRATGKSGCMLLPSRVITDSKLASDIWTVQNRLPLFSQPWKSTDNVTRPGILGKYRAFSPCEIRARF